MTSSNRRVSGFSLIEITLALGVAAVCLLTISGLLTVGVQTNRKSKSQNVATNIIAAAISDLRAVPRVPFGQSPTASQSLLFGIPLNGTTTPPIFFDLGGTQTTVASAEVYRLTVVTRNSGTTTPMYASFRVSWPAVIDPANGIPDGSVEGFAAIDLHY